jgi:Zn-dependent protease
MGMISLLTKDPVAFFVGGVLLLYSVIAHEVAHGWTAKLFGDTTAEEEGRLTANPLPHIDPLGLIMLVVAGFGWARPVPISYGFLRRAGRWALTVVSLAGVGANFLIACVGVAALHIPTVRGAPSVAAAMVAVVRVNVALAAFNLIPIPPLDGAKVLAEFLPWGARARFLEFERYGFWALILLLYTGLLEPVIRFMQGMVFGTMGLIFRWGSLG